MAHVPPYIYIHISYWRASEASETLSGVCKFELMRYVYIYIYIYMYGGTSAIFVAHATLCKRRNQPVILTLKLTLLTSERSERAQSCSCSIEISDTYVYIYIYIYVCGRMSSYVCACSVVRTVGGV